MFHSAFDGWMFVWQACWLATTIEWVVLVSPTTAWRSPPDRGTASWRSGTKPSLVVYLDLGLAESYVLDCGGSIVCGVLASFGAVIGAWYVFAWMWRHECVLSPWVSDAGLASVNSNLCSSISYINAADCSYSYVAWKCRISPRLYMCNIVAIPIVDCVACGTALLFGRTRHVLRSWQFLISSLIYWTLMSDPV